MIANVYFNIISTRYSIMLYSRIAKQCSRFLFTFSLVFFSPKQKHYIIARQLMRQIEYKLSFFCFVSLFVCFVCLFVLCPQAYCKCDLNFYSSFYYYYNYGTSITGGTTVILNTSKPVPILTCLRVILCTKGNPYLEIFVEISPNFRHF